jgi:sarcosine oxidase subunit gamma
MHELLINGGIILRVQTWGAEAVAPAGVEGLLGATWPREVGTAVHGSVLGTVICLGPTEWLVLGAACLVARHVEELDRAFSGTAFRTTDVSHALLRLHITGNAALSVLGKGCSLNLELAAFGVGRAVRTRLAGIPVVVWRIGPLEFECVITRSYGEYFRAWLDDAALEFYVAP